MEEEIKDPKAALMKIQYDAIQMWITDREKSQDSMKKCEEINRELIETQQRTNDLLEMCLSVLQDIRLKV